ncbi:MAG TPA: ATPase domain-containing protein [Methylophilaceae bacterium]|nr:ATPase domain-containing protein [Methylophilaceae bacterium]
MTAASVEAAAPTISSGIQGLDAILCGGFTPQRLYLVEGLPGTGKTTLALKFLLEGVAKGESVLYITLSETHAELTSVAKSHGWDLEGIHVHEVIPSEDLLDPAQQHTLFHPSEVELGDTTREISNIVEHIRPSRIVIDSLSELRLLASSALRYRRQVLAYKQFFSRRNCTVLMLDDRPDSHDMQIRSIAHGVIALEQVPQEYGSEKRQLRVVKLRGIKFRGGAHDYVIEKGGLVVFPRLASSEYRATSRRLNQQSSGLARLDDLLGGGLEEGTSTIVSGAPGTGKSSLASQFVAAAISRGQKAAMFVFEESANLLINRTSAINIDLLTPLEQGNLMIKQIDPAEMAPGQFTMTVTDAVESRGVSFVVIDSLNGYLNAMPNERYLTIHLHELLTFLGQKGVTTILVGVHSGMIGNIMSSAGETSYLADNVILLRHFEFQGEVRQAISVFKKRAGAHERTIREFSISEKGIHVGNALRNFHGVLTGVPTFEGTHLDES